jgi:hypothetical protein
MVTYWGSGEGEVNTWQLVVPLLQSWLDEWTAILASIPQAAVYCAVVVPVGLALISKQSLIVLGSLVLALTAILALAVPSDAIATVATGALLASILVAAAGIVRRRKDLAVRTEFDGLRLEVNHLLEARERRFLKELRAPKRPKANRRPHEVSEQLQE